MASSSEWKVTQGWSVRARKNMVDQPWNLDGMEFKRRFGVFGLWYGWEKVLLQKSTKQIWTCEQSSAQEKVPLQLSSIPESVQPDQNIYIYFKNILKHLYLFGQQKIMYM